MQKLESSLLCWRVFCFAGKTRKEKGLNPVCKDRFMFAICEQHFIGNAVFAHILASKVTIYNSHMANNQLQQDFKSGQAH